MELELSTLNWAVIAPIAVVLFALVVDCLVGLIDAISRWMPTSLLNALAEIPAGTEASSYLGATAVTMVVAAGLVWVAVKVTGRRLS